MFVTASPPRLTRRSRLDQWLLLLLRATALVLLALAFARPFWRTASVSDVSELPDRTMVVLVDTSASMRRAGIWSQVAAQVNDVVRDLSPRDLVALYSFDSRVTRLLSLEESRSAPAQERARLVRTRLEAARPGWQDSALGDALVLVADELDALADGTEREPHRQIVVISDLQAGSQIESLQAYQWPASVRVLFRQIFPEPTTNASLQILEPSEARGQERVIRVRVTNDAGSRRQDFEVQWDTGEQTERAAAPVHVSVPPGETRVVRMPAPPAAQPPVECLLLTGDDHDFDNRQYVIPQEPVSAQVVYAGDEEENDPERMLFYLQRGLTSDPRQPVEITTTDGTNVPELLPDTPELVVLTKDLPAGSVDAVRQYLERGGTVLLILGRGGLAVSTMSSLTGVDAAAVVDTQPDRYAMLRDIDVRHRLFSDFAHPPYNDFTQLSFWRYRRWPVPRDEQTKVLARFDTGDPALVELQRNRGSLFVLASGWHPDDSQFARSTKFVPLISRLAGRSPAVQEGRHIIGQQVSLSTAETAQAVTVRKPDGTEVSIPAGRSTFDATDQPGVYAVRAPASERRFVVNLSPAETQTDPLDVAQLEQRGVRIGTAVSRTEALAAQRQLRDLELEGRQRYWQWLIAGTLIVLVLETLIPIKTGRGKPHD
jgi:hypothetical protein